MEQALLEKTFFPYGLSDVPWQLETTFRKTL